MDAYQLPEIMRTPLEELCLQIKVVYAERKRDRLTERETDRCGFGSLDEDKIALNEFCECRGGTRTALLFLVLC